MTCLKIYRFALLIVALLFHSAASSQNELKLTLGECLDRALAGSPQLRLTSLQLQQSQASYNAEKRFLIPEIQAYARYFQYLDDRPVFVFPENSNPVLSGPVQLGAPMNFYSGITINQHLIDFRMFGNAELSRQFDELQRTRREMTEDEIYFEVVKTYYQAGIISGSMEVLEFNRSRLDRLETLTRTAVENEAALKTTLDEFILRKDELQIQARELSDQRTALLDYMKFLTALPEDTVLELIPMDESLPVQVFIQDSASYKAAEALRLQVELQEGQVRRESASSYPSLDLVMAFQWLQQEGYGDLFTSDANWFNQHMIGVQLNVPILNPDSRKSKKQQASISRDIMKVQQEMLDEKTRIDQGRALRKMVLSRDKAELAARKVDVYERIFRQERVRYEQAYSSLSDLLTAEEQYRSAQLELARSKADYFIAILEMYRAYGVVRSFTEQR